MCVCRMGELHVFGWIVKCSKSSLDTVFKKKKKTSNESNLIAANVYSITENHDAEEINNILASWRWQRETKKNECEGSKPKIRDTYLVYKFKVGVYFIHVRSIQVWCEVFATK